MPAYKILQQFFRIILQRVSCQEWLTRAQPHPTRVSYQECVAKTIMPRVTPSVSYNSVLQECHRNSVIPRQSYQRVSYQNCFCVTRVSCQDCLTRAPLQVWLTRLYPQECYIRSEAQIGFFTRVSWQDCFTRECHTTTALPKSHPNDSDMGSFQFVCCIF